MSNNSNKSQSRVVTPALTTNPRGCSYGKVRQNRFDRFNFRCHCANAGSINESRVEWSVKGSRSGYFSMLLAKSIAFPLKLALLHATNQTRIQACMRALFSGYLGIQWWRRWCCEWEMRLVLCLWKQVAFEVVRSLFLHSNAPAPPHLVSFPPSW